MVKVEELTAIIDSREQLPYDLAPFKTVRCGLPTGDYSVEGYETEITIERKSLDDFIGSISTGRERFEREIERLLKFESKMILVEGSAEDILKQRYVSRMNPTSVFGTIASFIAKGVPVMLAGNRTIAQDFARRFLFLSVKYRLPPVANSATKAG